MTDDEFMTAEEAATYLDVTQTRIYALTKAGKIGREKYGRYLYTREELDAWKAERNPKGGRPPKAGAGTLDERTIPA